MDHALMVLGFHELPEDKRPPESIWLDEPRLVDHFRTVKLLDPPGSASDNESGEWASNALADELLAGAT